MLFTGPRCLGSRRLHEHVFYATNLWMMNRDGTGLRNFVLDFSAVAGNPPAGGKR